MNFIPLLIAFPCLYNISLINSKSKQRNTMDSGCSECGRASYHGEMKKLIVDGRRVTPPNKYPWMVALMRMPEGDIICGGAIINRYFILTAAHCVKKYEEMGGKSKQNWSGTKEDILSVNSIQVGFLTDTHNPSEGAEIEKIIAHPRYEHFSIFTQDIALLKLKKPIKCNSSARPICLPGKNINISFRNIFGITGWGSENGERQDRTETLNEARVIITPPENCGDSEHSNESLCVEGYNGESPCFGDSGGSMFMKFEGKYFAVGVASTAVSPKATECDSNSGTFIYTSVKAHMPWIQNITGVSGDSA